MSNSGNHFMNEAEIEALVRGFEGCTLPDSEFDHPAHLTVALSYLYLSRLTVPEAATRLRAALYRFLEHHGHDRQKYHETITLFWIKLVRSYLDATQPAQDITDLSNEMVKLFGDSKIIYAYYSQERLLSDEARQVWVEPDLKPLDF
jgi:hypothetical protein